MASRRQVGPIISVLPPSGSKASRTGRANSCPRPCSSCLRSCCASVEAQSPKPSLRPTPKPGRESPGQTPLIRHPLRSAGSCRRSRFDGGRSVTAFGSTRAAQSIAQAPSVKPAGRDDPIVDDDAPAAPRGGDAPERPSHRQSGQAVSRLAAARSVQLRGVEIRQPDLDPGHRIGGSAHAESVAIDHMADKAGNGPAGPIREGRLARVGARDARNEQRQDQKQGSHAAEGGRPCVVRQGRPVGGGRKGRAGRPFLKRRS